MSHPTAAAETFRRFLARLEAGTAGLGDADPVPGPGPDMPPWLAQMVAVLFDGQDATAAKDWARRVHGELDRLGGRVPFGVVHDWHAHTVAPMLVEASAGRGAAVEPQQAAALLHTRALAGERVGEAEWIAALGPALLEVYRYAYAYADAYATAYASAQTYAAANDYSEDETVEFADMYAKLNTGANVASYADANAIANANASAAAYAAADAQAYAEAYPFAYVHAYAHAHANQDETAGQAERRRAAYRRLADGLADSLSRAIV